MGLKKASCRFGLLGTLLALSISTFLVSDAAAQRVTQYCECTDAYDTVAVRTVPVARRSKARKYRKAKRTTVARRSTTRVVRPAYQMAYVPAREVVYDDDDDCVDENVHYGTATRRVFVTERIHPTAERIYPVAGSRYYINGYNGDRINTSNGYARTQVYVDGRYSNLDVDADYFSTARIASDYGYRDGFSDGHEVGMERETYNPYKEGDYRNGTNGYEGHFGSKHLYKEAYRQAFLRGYDAGFRSVAQSSTYRAARW